MSENKKIKDLGEKIKQIRLHKKLSQEDLALKCEIEISQISRIERGVVSTGINNIFLIANNLEIDIKELFD